MNKAIFFLLVNLLAGAVEAQTTMDGQRLRIAAERASLQASFDLQSAACYKKFWVNNCLDDLKAERLGVMSDLRRQEVALNDLERKAKGAEQLQKLEEKASAVNQLDQQNERADLAKRAQTRAEREAKKSAATPPPKNVSAEQSQQDRQARKRSSGLAKQSEVASNVEKYEAKQIKAEARRAKKLRDLEAKIAQKIQKPASPLPPGPSP